MINLLHFAIIFFLIVLIANLIHWNRRTTECLLYFPRQGVCFVVLSRWIVVAAVATVAAVLGLLSSNIPVALCLLWLANLQGYSIWCRQHVRAFTGQAPSHHPLTNEH